MTIVEKNLENLLLRLKNASLGMHLSPEELAAIIERCDLVEYEAGELIIKEHDIDSQMFVVVQNSVLIEISGKDHPVYVSTLGEGEIIGEAGLFINVKRTASVRATEETQLLRLGRENFFDLLKLNSRSGIKLMFMIIYGLLSRLRMTNEELAFERRLDSDQTDIDSLIKDLIPEEAVEMLKNI